MHLAFVVNHAAFFVSHRLPLATEARRRGWHVTLFTGQAGSESMEAEAVAVLSREQITHYRLPFGSSTVNPLRESWGLLKLAFLMGRCRPDIVHAASPKGVLYGGIAARLSGVPSLVLAISGMGFGFTQGTTQNAARRMVGRVISMLSRLAFRHPSRKVIVQNPDDEQWVVASGLCPPEDVHLVPGSGVEEAFFSQADVSAKSRLVVFPARIVVDKGVCEFIEAARLIRREMSEWRFVIAGTADYRSPAAVPRAVVEGWVAEGLVEWPGYVADMASLLAQASIVCLPSYREGLPKALLEAAAAGCAVVTCDTVGCREAILPGKTGDLVPPRDPVALAAALLGLMQDRERRETYGRSGKLLARRKFSLDVIVADIFGLYAALRPGV